MKSDLNCEREKFLSLCCPHDYNLLTGAEPMNLKDFERLTYLVWALGYSSYQQYLEQEYLDLSRRLAEQAEREAEILVDYPDYYADENMLGISEQWVEEFLSHIPAENQTHYLNQIKENVEM